MSRNLGVMMATKKAPTPAPQKRARDAGSGEFVKMAEAKKRPKEVVVETFKKK